MRAQSPLHGAPARLLLLAAPLLLLAIPCQAVRFEVTANSKCIGEEIGEGVLVVGDYSIVDGKTEKHQTIAVKVMSPYGRDLHHVESTDRGHFGFTTKEAGQYMCCFWVPLASPDRDPPMTVDLEWKTGVDAKDWASIAKKEKLDGLGLELRKLEEAVHSVRDEMMYFRGREAEMRNLNELTNGRVAWLSIISLLVCLGLAALQLWHLKSFFERKKLL